MSFKEFMVEQEILAAPMMEMANLSSKDTGLAYVIWFGEVGGHHGPRIKVSNVKGKFAVNDNFVISVDPEPRILTPRSRKISQSDVDDICDWIKLNYDVLHKLWHAYEHDDATLHLFAQLKKL